MKGRVLAIDGDIAVVRGQRADVRIPAGDLGPGDLVDGGVVRRYEGPPYPAPGTEVARLTRRRMDYLHARAVALAEVRAFFASRDFVEVETPLVVPSPGLEIHLDAVRAGDGWLITSPEYHMKRLVAAGLPRIVQIAKCWRAEELGPHHRGEFTMVEGWVLGHLGPPGG